MNKIGDITNANEVSGDRRGKKATSALLALTFWA